MSSPVVTPNLLQPPTVPDGGLLLCPCDPGLAGGGCGPEQFQRRGLTHPGRLVPPVADRVAAGSGHPDGGGAGVWGCRLGAGAAGGAAEQEAALMLCFCVRFCVLEEAASCMRGSMDQS